MGGGARGAPEITGARRPLLLSSDSTGRLKSTSASAAELWTSAPTGWSARSILFGSRPAQAIARLSTCWARAVRARPRCVLAVGLLIAAAVAACNLAHAPNATLLEAWLPPDSWRQEDKRSTEQAWGAQRLDQVIVRPRSGRRWSATRGEDAKAELQAALGFLHTLTTTLRTTGGHNSTAYEDVCFEPAQPYAPGCLAYSPMAWWDGSVERFAADTDIWRTLQAPSAAGGVRGLTVVRPDVFSVQGHDGHDVTEVQALMLWLFIDVAPSRATPAYLARTAAFEDALLQSCAAARANSSMPFEAYCSISSSVQSEIQSSAAADVTVVVMTVGALFVFHLVVLCAMDLDNWFLNSISACTTGLTLTGVFGWMRICGAYGLLTPYPIQAMMLFLPLTMGLHHRVLIAGQCRSIVTKTPTGQRALADPARLLEVLCINILSPAACTMASAAGSMGYASMWMVTVPAIQGCAIVGAGGVVLDWVLLATVFLPAVALCQERNQQVQAKSCFEAQAVVDFGERPGPRQPSMLLAAQTHQASQQPQKCCQTAKQVQAGCVWCYRLLAFCGAAALLVLTGAQYTKAFVDGDSTGLLHPSISTQSLVPVKSEIKLWADNYAAYFGAEVSLPLDFPILVGDGTPDALMDPANGPSLVAAAAALRQDPRLNASSVQDWYGEFRTWCHKSYDGLHLCRNTMEGGDAGGMGYLTKRSFDDYLSFFIAGNQQLAADMKMSGPLVALKLQSAKFSAATPRGAVQDYAVQRDLPSAMHALAQRAFPPTVPAPGSGGGGGRHDGGVQHPLTAISYSPAFPFFELWEPAHHDIVMLGGVQLLGAAAICLPVLGLFQSTMVLLCVAGSVCSMLIALDRVFQQDLNMITAVNAMIFIPVGTDLFFHLGFRATALSCLRYRSSSAIVAANAACGSGSGSSRLVQSEVWRDDERGYGGVEELHAMHSAQLVAIVVLPATIGFAATVGFPLWLLLLCSSPLNALFAYLYQTMLILQACFGLLVRKPAALPPLPPPTTTTPHVVSARRRVRISSLLPGFLRCAAVRCLPVHCPYHTRCCLLACFSARPGCTGAATATSTKWLRALARAAASYGLVRRARSVEDSAQPRAEH